MINIMEEREKQYIKINEEYNQFTYMFYESMHNGNYSKKHVDKQITRLMRSLTKLKEEM